MAAFVASFLDSRQLWSLLALMGSVLFVVVLSFTLQGDLTRHYVSGLPFDTWSMHSASGFVLGVMAGCVVGVGGLGLAMRLSPSIVSYDVSFWLMPAAIAAAVVAGFAALGVRQAQALRPYVKRASWWAGVMAVAWVPVVIAWMGYDAVLGAMVINIYPGPHGTLKVLAAEAALLCPSLLAYALIVRRNRDVSAVSAPHLRQLNRLRERPAGTFAVMLAVPLAVVIAFVALLVGHSFLVERAWVAEGSQAT